MTPFKSLAAVALLTLPTPVLADAVTYRGTIGSIDVVVEFSSEVGAGEAPIFGRYFYPRKGIDIPLDPVAHSAGALTVREEKPCTEAACPAGEYGEPSEHPLGATWTLETADSGATLTGTWKEDGPQPVALARVGQRPFEITEGMPASGASLAEATLALGWNNTPMDLETAPYDTLKMTSVPLDSGAVTDLDGNQFLYVTDPRTKFAYPRLAALSDGSDIGPANAYLEARHWQMNAEALDCSARQFAGMGWNDSVAWAAGTLGDYDSETVTVQYLSPAIMSWTESGSLFCGGAHPYNHDEAYNLDVRTGEPLDLSRIFSGWLAYDYEGTEVDLETARANPADYRWGPAASLIRYVITNRVKVDDETLEADCGIDELIATNLMISFKQGNRAVFSLAGLSSAIQACGGVLLETDLGPLYDNFYLTNESIDYFPALGG